MILQYKGFNRNWCYTEAETVTYVTIDVSDTIRKVKNQLVNQNVNDSTDADNLSRLRVIREAVEKQIADETSWGGSLIYMTEGSIEDADSLCIVMLERGDSASTNVVYVFSAGKRKTVYLLNSDGKTVNRIC